MQRAKKFLKLLNNKFGKIDTFDGFKFTSGILLLEYFNKTTNDSKFKQQIQSRK